MSELARRRRPYAERMPIEQRREQLLDAALRAFRKNNYDLVSLEVIAQEAGVTRPVLYGAFDGLPEIVHALADRCQERAMESAMRLLPQNGNTTDVDAWLIQAAGALWDTVHAEPEVWEPILGVLKNPNKVIRERAEQTRDLVRKAVAHGLEIGLELRGGPMLDVELLSVLVLSTIEEIGRLTLADPVRYNRERLIGTLTKLLRAMPPANSAA